MVCLDFTLLDGQSRVIEGALLEFILCIRL